MAVIDITPQNSPKKPISGAFYGTSGFGVYASPSIFDGGMFVNGGFESGISNWKLYPTNGSWTATPDANTAQNIPNTTGTHFYQDFTLEDGVTYELSADQVGGDGTLTYCINTADSGIPITDGATRFLGRNTPESIGVTMSIAGSTPAMVDNLRLVKINNCVGFDFCMLVEDDGTNYGFASGFGSLIPNGFDGQTVIEFSVTATGTITMTTASGLPFDTFTNSVTFTADGYDGTIEIMWDGTNNRYGTAIDIPEFGAFMMANVGNHVGFNHYVFDGGLFVNGGFDVGITGWVANGWSFQSFSSDALCSTTATEDTLYQTFGLSSDKTYKMSCGEYTVNLGGTANWLVGGIDSGVPLSQDIEFKGNNMISQYGVIPNDNGGIVVVDELRLVEI